MPKRAKGRIRETWRDWQAKDAPDPGVLLTRDEFVQLLQSESVDATEQDLLYWQKIGIIPYPELKRVGRVGYAYYPFWMVEVIRLLRKLQAAGVTLEEMVDQLRKHARMVSVMEQWRPSQSPTTVNFLPHRLRFAATDMARVYTAIIGADVREIAVRITDERGSVHVVDFPFGPGFHPILHEYHDPHDD